MKEDVWKSFFRKLTGWHLATSLQINFFTDNFQKFQWNELLRMATSRSCIKCLKSTCEIVFYTILWLKFCNVYVKLAVSQRCSIKDVFWETSQNSQINTRSNHPEVFCQKMFLKIKKPEPVRSRHWGCFVKQGVLKNFAIFTGKNLCWSLYLINL